jgi:hypothetical protein
MVKNDRDGDYSFELIVGIFEQFLKKEEAFTTAYLFCISATGCGSLYVPQKSHKRLMAEKLLEKGMEQEKIIIATGISKRTLLSIVRAKKRLKG